MSNQNQLLAFVLILLSFLCFACSGERGTQSLDGTNNRGGKADQRGGVDLALPGPGGSGASVAWGGPHNGLWNPESVFANAVSTQLNEVWSRGDTTDAVVAVPVAVGESSVHPYGDGQSNAAIDFPFWEHKEPPVVAVAVQNSLGEVEVEVGFEKSLNVQASPNVVSESGPADVSYVRTDELGRTWYRVETDDNWFDRSSPPRAMVTPPGWNDSFPLHFYLPVTQAGSVVASMTPEQQAFGGAGVPDPEGVAEHANPFDALVEGDFLLPYNTSPYEASDVHGNYPHRHDSTTAVGKSYAWVVEQDMPFKQVYLCVEGRRVDLEVAAGAPSGSGWHKIGDAAETLAHTLEGSPILVGWASHSPWKGTPFEANPTAYQLNSVATAGVLWPGEALVATSQGGPFVGVANFHWYAFPDVGPACVEIWVHPCAPTSGIDFVCEDTPLATTRFSAEVQTQPGEDVWVVGTGELGEWDVEHAIPLVPDAYPTWTSTSVALSPGTTYAFKLVKVAPWGVIWQGGPNHTFVAGESDTLHVAW